MILDQNAGAVDSSKPGLASVPDRAGARALDYLLIGLFSLLLFGCAGFSGRPLTMHEARLPECAREMLHRGDWLLPTSGGRPWLERPPLPHWCVMAAMKLFGHDDRVWIVRLPSAIAGAVTVLLTAWMAGRLFGRATGVAAGLMLATSYEFYVYACQAEDDIYLAALVAAGMALFVRTELLPGTHRRIGRFGFITNRPWPVLGFFTLLGLTNLTKGPLLGLVFYLGAPAGVFLLFRSWAEKGLQPIARYLWLWGLLVTVALTVAWPAWAYHNYPDVLQNFKYDYGGRMNSAYTELNEPWYYYVYELPTAVLPWTIVLLIAGVWRCVEFFGGVDGSARVRPATTASAGTAAAEVATPVRRRELLPAREDLRVWLLLIWGLVPVLLLSVPSGKHHHYLVPFIAPWAMLAAVSGVWVCRRTGIFQGHSLGATGGGSTRSDSSIGSSPHLAPGDPPGEFVETPGGSPGAKWVGRVKIAPLQSESFFGKHPVAGKQRTLFFASVLALGIIYSAVQSLIAGKTDHTIDDTAFLIRVRGEVPADLPLFIDAKMGPVGNLDFFRTQFYSRSSAVLLHNLSFLRDQNITAPVVYVICRQKDERLLRQLGTVTQIDQSRQSHQEWDDKTRVSFGKFTLYRLEFMKDLVRYPAPARMTNLQAMERAPGPWCGPALQ